VGTYNYIALWFSMSMEITTYKLASSLIAKGMDWKQAVGTVLLGNLIVLVPMLLNAHAGAKYGIPFPVFIRAPFGVRGANLPAILRAIVACGWFGIQAWIGGTAIHSMLAIVCLLSRLLAVCSGCVFSLLAPQHDCGLARCGVHSPPAGLRSAVHVCDGGGIADLGAHQGGQLRVHALHAQRLPLNRRVPQRIFPSLTAMVGYWATLALNIPDFTRYAKNQGSQAWGQAFGLPVAMTLYTFVALRSRPLRQSYLASPSGIRSS